MMRTFPTITLASILLILILATCYAATTTKDSSSSSSTTYDASSSRRERNLDHWDAETLAAYLGMDPTTGKPLPTSTSTNEPIDQYVGHDAAIMFYAQWCPNCHQLAPIWDAIASLLNAGSKKSNLIMALFDCEKDTIHMKLCSNAGVRHYPTLMFVGSGPIRDTDPFTSAIVGKDKSAGPAGATVLERAVKFQGNLGYSESIMDWIRTMQGLSSWHKLTESGALRFVRDGFLGFLFRKKSGNKGGVDVDSLPVGVPPTFRAKQASSSTADGGASMADVLQNKALETKLKTAQDEKAKMEKLATHASLLLDNVLCPEKPTPSEIGAATIANQEPPTYRDAYATLYNTNGWEAKATLQTDKTPAQAIEGKTMEQITTEILRTCTIELSLDYCTRVSTHVTNDFLDELAAMSDDGELNEYPSMLELEKELVAKIEKDEPYCASFDECLKNDFDDGDNAEVCRPKSCPFRNEVACRYVSSCFIESIQDEYGVALGYLEEEGGIGSLKSLGEAMELAAASSDATASGGGGGGWGFAK